VKLTKTSPIIIGTGYYKFKGQSILTSPEDSRRPYTELPCREHTYDT